MINGSFVFGMDSDDPSIFARTVDWAVKQGIETATFHILTPYPSTALYQRMQAESRLLHSDWDLYDTRHTVFRPKCMTAAQLEAGYWDAYKNFYSWRNIVAGASSKSSWLGTARHMAYAVGWKKLEGLWNLVIRLKQVGRMRPTLESVLSGLGLVEPSGNVGMTASKSRTVPNVLRQDSTS
jgi:radical SAM superfamily enzyme YgiQ (UPF0313 family)